MLSKEDNDTKQIKYTTEPGQARGAGSQKAG